MCSRARARHTCIYISMYRRLSLVYLCIYVSMYLSIYLSIYICISRTSMSISIYIYIYIDIRPETGARNAAGQSCHKGGCAVHAKLTKTRQTWETRTARKARTPRGTCRAHKARRAGVAAGPPLALAPGLAGENLQRGVHRVIQLRGELGLERSQLSKLLLELENLCGRDERQ